MPAAIPIIAAFASGAVSAVVAGTAGLAAYATVAGAVLTGVGALTGKKDLMKIGAVLSLGGGIASAFGVGQGAAASALPDAGRSVIGMDTMGPQAIENAAAGGISDVASAATAVPDISSMDGITSTGQIQDAATGVTNGAAQASAPPNSLAALAQKGGSAAPGAGGGLAGDFATQGTTVAPAADSGGRLAEMSKGITSNDLSSWWERAKKAGSGVGQFMEKNPNLMRMTGDVLSSMYGPAAEKMDWEKSLYERSRRNLNSPVAMTYTPGGKP